ncbi:MAG: fibronectin type III domain-containing protein [Bacteroidales bacterium]|nr:fibronectin type III domain-containing protein [Bacteroidales bacterium]
MFQKYFAKQSLILLAIVFAANAVLSGQVVIQRCDVATGWQGAQAISVDKSDYKEGFGALQTVAQAGQSDWFSKKFSGTQTGISTSGYLTLWLYVSDASMLDGGAIEVSSSGGPGDQTHAWAFGKADVTNGWNNLQLQISAASQSGGGADLENINYFRIHQTLSGAVTAKIDFIRFTPSTEAPVWPVLDVPVVDNSTLDGKVMFGYQGWFNHPDDGAGLGWVHWGNFYEPLRSTVDMYPDMREYGQDEKYDAHLTFPDGSMAPVFSSFNRNTVVRHMKWVRDYNLDGVFLQRFISNADSQKGMDHKDTVTTHVMEGCEKYGRVFAIMYDGVANRVEDMQADWKHLVDDIGVTNSDRYLRTASLATQVVRGYAPLEETLGTPPEGIMTIRITDEANDNNQGTMEFLFPDFPGETTIEISIDGGATFPYSTPDNAGTYLLDGLSEGTYPVVVRHGAGSPEADMGDVTISNVFEGLPGQAVNPFPADGATGVRLNTALGWTPGEHAVSHHIYFGTTQTPDSVTYQFSNSFSPGDLEPETTYYWRIDEENGSGQAEGPAWSFTTGTAGGPTDVVVLDYCDEVTGWSSTNGAELDSENKQEGFASLSCTGGGTDKFKKTFDPPVNTFCDESSYFNLWIYVSDVSAFDGGGQIEITSSGRPDTDEYSWSVPDLNLVNGWNELSLQISSASVNGNPDLGAINFFRFYQFVSSEIETKIDYLHFSGLAFAKIAAPANLAATPGDQSVTLDWDDNTEADLEGYNVYRSLTSGSGYEKLNSEPVTASTYEDDAITAGTTYYYIVKAVNTAGEESQASNEVAVTPGTNSVVSDRQLLDFRLFPNPATSLATARLTLEEASGVTVTIFDAGGRQLHHFIQNEHWMPGTHTLRLPLNGFATGSYMLHVKVGKKIMTEVLVIEL